MRVADWYECTESLGANLWYEGARSRQLVPSAPRNLSSPYRTSGTGLLGVDHRCWWRRINLVDDLLARGYKNVTVIDVSQTAIDVSKKRLGDASDRVKWLVVDITKGKLAPRAYDVWHDRAVFHFLTTIDERTAYVRQVAHAVKPEGT